jgi:hypothetical protein
MYEIIIQFRFILNGSMASENIRKQSTKIQTVFEDHFNEEALPYELAPFTGRSDYGPFLEFGIPAG